MIAFSDINKEKLVIAGLLAGPNSWKNFPESWLTDPIALSTYRYLKTFLGDPYHTYPTIAISIEKASNPDVLLYLQEVSTLIVEPREMPILVHDLYEMYANRKVVEVARSIPGALEKEKVSDLIRSKIADLSTLINPFETGQRERGFIYDNAKERWLKYTNIEKNPDQIDRTPFGIGELDEVTNGGIRPGYIVCFFADTGGMKTKTKANIAYNMAFQSHKDVMVITLEVPKADYEAIIDSRHALLDFGDIVNGRLGEERSKHRQALMDIVKDKPNLYIVDIPDKATSADVVAELELYYVKFGKYPHVVILDYINEMEPVSTWNNTSDKFKNLGVELRRIVRSYNIGFITSMQGNREGKKVKDKEKVGIEHMSESHYFSNVCHVIAHLYQDENGIDETENMLNCAIKKNRFGKKDVTISMFANPAINYIGDRKLY